MIDCYRRGPLNPSSQHGLGRAARSLLDNAISEIGQYLGADCDSPGGDQLVLTSGGSESNNLALAGLGDLTKPLVVSAIEHPSVLAVAAQQQQRGREVRIIPASASGVVDIEQAARLIAQQPTPALVSVMAANNETGVIQPLDAIARLCQNANVPLHIDATQAIGKLPFRFAICGASAVSFTAHKFHGPSGIGGLLVRAGVELHAHLQGGEQQLGKRPGTEAVPLAVGMGFALQLATSQMAGIAARIQSHRDEFENRMSERIDGIVFYGKSAPRLPGTSCFSLPGVDRQIMLMALDRGGIACSSGSACASGSSRPSHVLAAMGRSEAEIESTIRLGLSKFTTANDMVSASNTICFHHQRLRRKQTVEKPV